jgi:hypothetical protein
MSTISSIADKNISSGGVSANTGKLGNDVSLKTPLHLIGLKSGFKIPAATTFDLAYINGLIQAGSAIPLIGADSFEPISAEDSYSTNAAGIKRINLKGLPEYKLTFEEGHAFYKELSKIESFKALDFIIGYEGDNWRMVENSDGTYSGFTAGHVTPEMSKEAVQGGNAESKSLVVQFLNRKQWDTNYITLTRDNLDFDALDVTGINAVELAFTAIPSNLDTTITLSAVLDADRSTNVSGLLTSDFRVKVNGVVTATTFVEAGNVYTGTLASLATSDVVIVDLYDSSASSDVVINSSVLYRSNAVTETVIV